MPDRNSPDISIVFIVLNGMNDYFPDTLAVVKRQVTRRSFEIIVIDSGSTDGTVDFVKKDPNIRLYEIPNSEFGHGKTRQMGVGLARGKYLVYLVVDATPLNEHWLENLVDKLVSENDIVAVSGRVLPRDNAIPIRKYNLLAEWCAGEKDFVIRFPNLEDFKKLVGYPMKDQLLLNNVTSAYRREILEKIGFGDVKPIGEDQVLAKKILEAGYALAFASNAVVYHSHHYGLKKAYKRNYDDGLFNRKYFNHTTVVSWKEIVGSFLHRVKEDFFCLIKDRQASVWQKITNFLYSPVIHLAELLGQYKGNKP